MGDEMKMELERSEKLLCKGLKDINDKGELNATSLQLLGEAIDAYRDIQQIYEMDSGMRSGGMDSYQGRHYMDGGGGYSRYGRRDSMGRYADDGYGNYRGEGYIEYRDDGYSRRGYRGDSYGHEADEDHEYLEWKMRNAKTDQEREKFRRKLEQAKM